MKDDIYNEPLPSVGAFRFDEATVRVFEDMIRRSVPGYGMTLSMISLLGERHLQPGSTCYDLGCSLGAGTLAALARIPERDCRVVAVDTSEPMIARCRENVADSRVDCRVQDVRETAFENASLVLLNFTLQFVPLEDRLPLLARIYEGLRPGGLLLLSEKLSFQDSAVASFQTEMHHDFKRAQGYSDLEISQKRTALENVLVPETLDVHIERLHKAGFPTATPWFQCFSFVSIAAIKN